MSRGHKPAVEHMVENVDRCSRAAVEHINEACKNGMEGEDGDQGPVRLQVTAERDIVSLRSERLRNIWEWPVWVKKDGHCFMAILWVYYSHLSRMEDTKRKDQTLK